MVHSSSTSLVATLTLAGRTWGEVRRLDGFDKKRHSVPDQVNGATQAFLAKLCGQEIAEEGEAFFRSCRSVFGYKRRDLSLSIGTGTALLETKDFALELRCELDAEDPSRYFIESELTRVAGRDLLESDELAEAIGPRFDRLRLGIAGSLSVAAVIDAVEDDESGDLSVDYPSDCSMCAVRIEEVDAEIVVDGSTVELRFPRLATGANLIAAYDEIGGRFAEAPGLQALRAHF